MRKLLWSVVLLLGCGDAAGPADLLYVTTVKPTVLRVGEQAVVTTTVVNVSNQDYTIGAPGNCSRVFLVSREDGTALLPKGLQCLAASIATVRRGQVVAFNEAWKPDEAGTYLVRSLAGFRGAREGAAARVEVNP